MKLQGEIHLTESQTTAINETRQIFLNIHPFAQFTVYQPHNTGIIRLVAEYTMANALGKPAQFSSAWSIGKRGKVTKNENVRIAS